MEILNYILIVIVSSLGLLAGCILAKYAKEEIRDAKRFFPVMQSIIAAVIFAVVLATHLSEYKVPFTLAAALVVAFAAFRLPYAIAWYSLFGLLLGVAAKTDQVSTVAGLIFIYGLPQGSLMYAKEKSWRAVIPLAASFIMIAVAAVFFV